MPSYGSIPNSSSEETVVRDGQGPSDDERIPSNAHPDAKNLISSKEDNAIEACITTQDDIEDDRLYKDRLGNLSMATLIVCLYTTGFFTSLDATVIFTTLNDIGTEFECSNIAAWVHTSYMLCRYSDFINLDSNLSNLFGRQPMLICVAAFFLIGSTGCSYATSFSQLIVARVIQGIGGGGATVMIVTVLHDLLPAKQRSQYQSYANTAQTLGLAFGPPIGGFITETFGWRYCFKINIIPFLIILYVYCFRLPNYSLDDGSGENDTAANTSVFKKLYRIDFLGAILLGAANTTFTTGVTLGGNTRAWTDPFILSMLTMAVLFFLTFGIYEAVGAAYPLVSRAVVSNSNVIGTCIANHLWGLGTSVSFYALPQLFMGVLGFHPSQSGIWIMVESVSNAAGCAGAGLYLRHWPRYRAYVLTAVAIYAVAIGVISLWTSTTFPFMLGIACIIIEGYMCGSFVVTTLLAASAEIPREEVSVVSSMVVMCRVMGYMNGVAISSAILQGTLKVFLHQHIQGDDADRLVEFIRTSIRKVYTLPPDIQNIVVEGLGLSIQRTFWFAVACTIATFFIVLTFMKNHALWSKPSSR
ncbi:major facilitator superfamily domain-containing protein [Fennellomyces sp. T-0311]|nr:major facilitator superfamily domain-containing protein [Fennellomyces sp. T-0311]